MCLLCPASPKPLLSRSPITTTLPVFTSQSSLSYGLHLMWVSAPPPGYTWQLHSPVEESSVIWDEKTQETPRHSFRIHPGSDCSSHLHCWHPTGATVTSLLVVCDDLLTGRSVSTPAALQSLFNISQSTPFKPKSDDVSLFKLFQLFPISLNVKPKALKSLTRTCRMWSPILFPETLPSAVLFQHMSLTVLLKRIPGRTPLSLWCHPLLIAHFCLQFSVDVPAWRNPKTCRTPAARESPGVICSQLVSVV